MADRRCWSWLGKPSQIRITELVRRYVFEATTIEGVSANLEIDELRPLFSEPAKAFEPAQKELLFKQNPHPMFIDDAISGYAKAGSFRGAEELFDSMVRPFMSAYQAENIIAVLDAAMANGQIYCAAETRVQMVDLFERTSDLFLETSAKWKEFLTFVLRRYDEEHRIYNELEHRVTDAGIWPVPDPLAAEEPAPADGGAPGT